jgi:hypothetical protein
MLPISNSLKKADIFITISFQLCFSIRQDEGLEKRGGTEIDGAHQLLVYTVLIIHWRKP